MGNRRILLMLAVPIATLILIIFGGLMLPGEHVRSPGRGIPHSHSLEQQTGMTDQPSGQFSAPSEATSAVIRSPSSIPFSNTVMKEGSSPVPAGGADTGTGTTDDDNTGTQRLPNGSPGLSRVFSASVLLAQYEQWRKESPRLPMLSVILDRTQIDLPQEEHLKLKGNSELVKKALGSLLGRTRLRATLQGSREDWIDLLKSSSGTTAPPHHSNQPETEHLENFLFEYAPSWYVAFVGGSEEEGRQSSASLSLAFVVARRSKLFCFAITGGSDKRANYVEWTWGRRTPLQWYADQWSPELRPIVHLHPQYLKDRFKYLTFKISRIWERVYEDYYRSGDDGGAPAYDWYVRLWDDNYFYEENVWNSLGRINPRDPVLVGKIGWRYLGDQDVYPFAGGGAGWFLSRPGMKLLGQSIKEGEKWFFVLRGKKIFLPHAMHDEDVFLTAWLHKLKVNFTNIPGVEHVSPGMQGKQRCMPDDTLYKLRWDPNTTIVFDYPAHESQFRIEEAWYAYTKPIVWHYMSPRRLVKLETLLYRDRVNEEVFGNIKLIPPTNADIVKARKKCYPGFTGEKEKVTPTKGKSVFEVPLPDPPQLRKEVNAK